MCGERRPTARARNASLRLGLIRVSHWVGLPSALQAIVMGRSPEVIGQVTSCQGSVASTAMGLARRKLLALSDRFEGERLDAEAIAEELRQRRGGLS